MKNPEHVLDKLRRLANESNEEGILYLHEKHYNGVIYIKNGYVRYCFAENHYGAREEGFHSLLRILALEAPEWHWETCELPEEKTIKIPIERVLESVEIMSEKRNAGLTRKTARLQLPRKQEIDLTKVNVYLHVDKGSLEGERSLILKDKTTIGRGLDCDIRLPDPTVSTLHGQFILEGNTIYLEDLDSFNGTRINHVNINKYPVTFDDVIEIGEVKVHLSYHENEIAEEDGVYLNGMEASGLEDISAAEESNVSESESRADIQRKLRQVTRVVEKKSLSKETFVNDAANKQEAHHESHEHIENSEGSEMRKAPNPSRIERQRRLRQITTVVENMS